MKFIIKKFRSELEIEEDWQLLWRKSASANYFNSFLWFKTCMAVFNYKKVLIVTVYKGKNLEALIPLIEVSSVLGVTYINPGGKYIDKSALLFNDNKALVLLLEELRKLSAVILTEVPEEVASQASGLGYKSTFASPNYLLPFESNPFRFVNSKNLRKIKKVLEENPNSFDLKILRGDIEALRTAIKIDLKSYREAKHIGTFRTGANVLFFEKLLELNSEDIGINILYFKKKAIAYEIGIRSGETYHGLNKSFDNNYKKLTPGKVLAYLLFKGLNEEGIKTFDFSRGEDMLKRSFTQIKKIQYDIYSFSNPLHQMSFIARKSLRNSLVNSKSIYSIYRRFVTVL